MQEGIQRRGYWRWRNHITRNIVASIGYEVNTTDSASPWVRVYYSIPGTREKISCKVRLRTTQPYFGGVRWWFSCHLAKDGKYCGRRVGKLYLPSGSRYFGCRLCYDLSYRSSQEHDKRVDFYRKRPEALWMIIKNPDCVSPAQLLLALKTLNSSA